MLALTVHVALGKAEIDNIYGVTGLLCSSDQKVIRLDIAVDDSLLVDLLDVTDELDGNVKHCLEV